MTIALSNRPPTEITSTLTVDRAELREVYAIHDLYHSSPENSQYKLRCAALEMRLCAGTVISSVW